MTDHKRHLTDDKRQKTAPPAESRRPSSVLRPLWSVLLLGLCLCILALRVTYTESPTAQMITTPGSLGDTVYSLTLSGLLIFAFVFWLLWGVFTGRLVYRFSGIEIGLAVFGVAAVVAAFVASDKRTAITQIMTLLGPVFAALLLIQILDSSAKVRVVLAVMVGLGIVSTYACAEQLFISNSITIEQYEQNPQLLLEPLGIETGTFPHFLFEHRLYSRGVRGFFTTSNSAASFGLLAAAAAVLLLLRRLQDCRAGAIEARYGLFAGLATVLVVAGLFLTQSKGGILALFVGTGIGGLLAGIDRWFPTHRQRILRILITLGLLLAVGAGYTMVHYGIQHGRLPGGNSMLVRWQYWAASAKMIADHHLTGIGPGNFSDYYTHYKPGAALESVADPHNFVLSVMTQYGPLGLIGFLALVLVPLGRLIAAHASAETSLDARPPAPFRPIALVMVLSIAACLLLLRLLLLPTLADSPDVLLYVLLTVHIAPVAAFLIGFLLVAAPLDDANDRRTNPANLTPSLILGCALLAVLLHNLVDYALFEPGVWTAFWVMTACLIATLAPQQTVLPVTVLGAHVRRPVALGMAAVFVGAYLLLVWRPVFITATGIQQAQHAASNGNYDVAHLDLEAAMRNDPVSPVAANFSGRLYVQQYEQNRQKTPTLLEEAARCFATAIERNPADYKNYEKLAMVYTRLGQREKAYEWYLKAAERYPGCERIWFELAQTAEQMGKTGLALCHYAKAVEIEESYQQQFRRMYPDREKIVSRLGDKEYQHAKRRIEELSK
jgi:tetratricopeptide (TPR) repeat protein